MWPSSCRFRRETSKHTQCGTEWKLFLNKVGHNCSNLLPELLDEVHSQRQWEEPCDPQQSSLCVLLKLWTEVCSHQPFVLEEFEPCVYCLYLETSSCLLCSDFFMKVWAPCSSFIFWCDKSLRWIQRLHDGSETERRHRQIIPFHSQYSQFWYQLLSSKGSTTRMRRSCSGTSCLTPPDGDNSLIPCSRSLLKLLSHRNILIQVPKQFSASDRYSCSTLLI